MLAKVYDEWKGGASKKKKKKQNILDLVEHDTAGLVDAEQAHGGSYQGDGKDDLEVRDWEQKDIIVLNALRGVIILTLRRVRLEFLIDARRCRRGGRPRDRRLGARRSSHGWTV